VHAWRTDASAAAASDETQGRKGSRHTAGQNGTDALAPFSEVRTKQTGGNPVLVAPDPAGKGVLQSIVEEMLATYITSKNNFKKDSKKI